MPAKESCTTSSVRKLKPRVKWPGAAALGGLSPSDIETLRRRLLEPVECVFDAFFQQADAESTLLGPLPHSAPVAIGASADSDDSGADLLLFMTGRALTAEQERHLFLRLNYCRYRLMRLLRKCRGNRLSAPAVRELLRWERLSTQTRGDIVRLNVALVLAMAKRTKLTGVDYADLVSEGNLALLRSVDKFDCSRGFKFSTYACRAILKSFSRVATRTARYRGYFPTEFDPLLEKGHQVEQKRQHVEEDCVDELKSILGENLAHLNDVEQRVIRARFAIGDGVGQADINRAKTLEQVGEMIGVTKERVRQIQNKALGKLRLALEQGILAV
jgi:RNA polymerase primary sigma factor